jgi:hypothetical protein
VFWGKIPDYLNAIVKGLPGRLARPVEKIFTARFSKKNFYKNKKTNCKKNNWFYKIGKHFFSKVFYSKMIDIKNKNKKVNAPISIPFIIRKPFR